MLCFNLDLQHLAFSSSPATLYVVQLRAWRVLSGLSIRGSSKSLLTGVISNARSTRYNEDASSDKQPTLFEIVPDCKSNEKWSIQNDISLWHITHMTSSSSLVKKVIDVPILPARPVRPRQRGLAKDSHWLASGIISKQRKRASYQYDERIPLSYSPFGS
jgi:hypothetical protein